jgi:hypothetical protein
MDALCIRKYRPMELSCKISGQNQDFKSKKGKAGRF